MLKPDKKTVAAILLPLTVAAAVRFAAFIALLDSPLRYYSYISGLDMQGLLSLGDWLYNCKGIFSIYSGLIALIMAFNGGEAAPPLVLIALQYIMGIGCCGLISVITLRLSGNRTQALLAGIIAATYAPELMYESVTLRESTMVFFSVLLLAIALWAHRKKFTVWPLIILGAVAASCSLVRFSAVIWTFLVLAWAAALWSPGTTYLRLKSGKLLFKDFFRQCVRRSVFLIIGLLIVFIPVSLFNWKVANHPLPFYVNVKYAKTIGKQAAPEDMNSAKRPTTTPAPKSATNTPKKQNPSPVFIVKFIEIFMPFEKSNNLNYYFIKDHFMPLGILSGPLLILPLALCGILLMILRRRLFSQELILLFYLIAFIIPLCRFVPLGRYRLILLPIFCYAAALVPVYCYRQWRQNSRIKALLVVLAAGIIYSISVPKHYSYRAEDYVAWGKASLLDTTNPQSQIDALHAFQSGFEMSPDSVSAAWNFAAELMRRGACRETFEVCRISLGHNPGNEGMLLLQAAAAIGLKKPLTADKSLNQIKEPRDAYLYNYLRGEAAVRLEKDVEAKEFFTTAVKAAKNQAQKNTAINKLNAVTD